MKLESLTENSRKGAKRVGRGSGSGTGKTCGKGHKGQMARKGHKHKPGFEGGQMRLVRRLPKRGFKNPAARRWLPVNVSALNMFDDGAEVTITVMRSRGLANGSADGIKILGGGKLEKKLIVKASAFSGAARNAIEAAGGTCEIVKPGAA